MTTIELADGTSFEGTVGIAEPNMCLTVSKRIAQQHLLDFMDKEKMHTVTFRYGLYWDVYTGYDTMLFVEPKPDKTVNVWFAPASGVEPSIERELTDTPDIYLPE